MYIRDLFDYETADNKKDYAEIPKQMFKELIPSCRTALYHGEPVYLDEEEKKELCHYVQGIVPDKTMIGCLPAAIGFFYMVFCCAFPIVGSIYLWPSGIENVISRNWLTLTVFLIFVASFVVMCCIFSGKQKVVSSAKKKLVMDKFMRGQYKAFEYPIEQVIRFYHELSDEPVQVVEVFFKTGGIMVEVYGTSRCTRSYSGKFLELKPEAFECGGTFIGAIFEINGEEYFYPLGRKKYAA